MTTDDLRVLTARCLLPRGKIWPNGLGFDHWGWEYTYDEGRGEWHALDRRRDRAGYGASPVVAKQAARKAGPR